MADQILIVEDENIVAKDIQRTLQRLGYVVPATVATGDAAIEKVEQLQPDLVLMDIRLRGPMDGIAAAGAIRDRWEIPVVYLTAHADPGTLERAKVSEPFGYILKPFEERDLQTTIEMALYKHRIDRKLRESERWLTVTLNSIGDGVIATDNEGRIVLINPLAQSLTGWTAEDAVGRPLAEIFHIANEQNGQSLEDSVAKVLASGVTVGLANHTVLTARDGTQRPIDDSAAPIRDHRGEILGVVLIFRDITDRRKAENALREQKENLQTLLETLPVAVFLADDPDCRRISGNRAAAELLRLPCSANFSMSAPAEERPSNFRNVKDGQPVAPDCLPLQRAARGEIVRAEELDHEFDDGTVNHVLVSAQPLYDSAGHPRGAVACTLDITVLKNAETELREADRRKDEFLAILAHELRNPLAPMRNAVELLKLAGDDHEVFEEARDMMERQLGHMVRLIDDLLDVSRITRDKLELRKERVDLMLPIHQALETCRPLVKEMNQELTVSLPPEPILVQADRMRLAQAFGNLLGNACKYTPPKGRIGLTVEREGGDVVVKVKDNGMGIPPDRLLSVFEMFTQMDRSLERSQAGLGIGLTLVKRLVEMHGGSVEARSEGLGQGSEFVVRLPVNPVAPEARPHESASVMAPIMDRRILVVDDNRDSTSSLSLLLNAARNETCTAHDGVAAIEAADEFRPEVVLLDIGLPKVNGYDVCRAIRRRTWGRSAVIIALTGWGQEEDRFKSAQAGFDGHLVKPVELKELASLLATIERSRGS